jgi:hypothetical protein
MRRLAPTLTPERENVGDCGARSVGLQRSTKQSQYGAGQTKRTACFFRIALGGAAPDRAPQISGAIFTKHPGSEIFSEEPNRTGYAAQR